MYNTYIHISCHTHTHTQFTWPTAATGPACDVLVRPAQRCSAATTITCRSIRHMRKHMERHPGDPRGGGREGTNTGGQASTHARACMRAVRHILSLFCSPPAPADAPSGMRPMHERPSPSPPRTQVRTMRARARASDGKYPRSGSLACLRRTRWRLRAFIIKIPPHTPSPPPLRWNGRNERTLEWGS